MMNASRPVCERLRISPASRYPASSTIFWRSPYIYVALWGLNAHLQAVEWGENLKSEVSIDDTDLGVL